jgi:hypothetical protein
MIEKHVEGAECMSRRVRILGVVRACDGAHGRRANRKDLAMLQQRLEEKVS